MAQSQCVSIVALATRMIKNKLKILDFSLLRHLISLWILFFEINSAVKLNLI